MQTIYIIGNRYNVGRSESDEETAYDTEQIDALEIMGVNSANYLILPKIVLENSRIMVSRVLRPMM